VSGSETSGSGAPKAKEPVATLIERYAQRASQRQQERGQDMTDVLVLWSAAREALAKARDIDEVKAVRDKASALRLYAQQRGESHEMQNDIAEIKLRAERRAGELLTEIPHETGKRTDLTSSDDVTKLQETGISRAQSSQWQKEAALPEEDFERYVAETKGDGGELTSAGLLRVAQRHLQQQAPNPAIDVAPPAGKFSTIVIDPPWPIRKILRQVRPAQDVLDYPTMSLDDIAALTVPDLMDMEGCHVYLWTTHKFLPRALTILQGWGVRYQCLLTWVKPTGMTPYSWMYNTEHVLFGRAGKLPLDRLGLKLSFTAPVIRHSEKPAIFYQRVRQASPAPRLEMFAREPHEGFVAWGNEAK